jgi:tetrahydromethanopterin S-methyltransferase subunit G
MTSPFQQNAPSPPAPKAAPAPNVVSTGSLPGVAMTKQEIANLRARRSELSEQLESATGRRRSLAEQVRRADGVNKSGLEARLATLDQRIVRLEGELDQVGQQLSSPQAAQYVAQTSPPVTFRPQNVRFSNVDPEPIIICFILFVMSPIALSISRLIWKRGSRSAMAVPVQAGESGERLERIEQAVDAISIEVERVSEGQRFVTRLLSERGGISIGAGQQSPDPVRVPVGESSRVR